ncbi:MAG: hypothetical protein JOZ51_01100 [Chloroflexi bacterium]|nr:hypothetical protein [Chloroflexota bacterium]
MSFHLKSTLPDFAAELENKLIAKGLPAYAAQVAELIVTDRCCGDQMCASMICDGYDGENVPLEEEDQVQAILVEEWYFVVIAFKGKIVNIELLDRPEIRAVLDELLPVRPEKNGGAAEPEAADDRPDAERR